MDGIHKLQHYAELAFTVTLFSVSLLIKSACCELCPEFCRTYLGKRSMWILCW